MKKILLGLAIGVVVLAIVGVLAVTFLLDGTVKRGVETFGPKLTKVDVKLDGVSISILSGSGSIKGLIVGNPEGYKTSQAISVGSATLALKPTSILGEKVVINKIELLSPEITFEGGFGGNNLSKILANLEETTGGTSTNAAAEPDEGPNQKLQVDDFLIRGAKVHVSVTGMGGKTLTVPIPDIHLTDLGTGPDGITAAELTKRVIKAIEQGAIKAADGVISDLGKQATEIGRDLGKTATGSVTNITGGLKDLLKKK
jgi:hypothetical protein